MHPHRLGRSLLLATLVVSTALAGCGDRGGPGGPPDAAATGGDVPVTPGALAVVTAEHLGTPDHGQAEDDLEELGRGTLGAQVRYGATGEDDGDLLSLSVVPRAQPSFLACRGRDLAFADGCVDIEGGALFWQEVEPEEDPGVIYLSVVKGDAMVFVYQAGPDVSGDPRELDLPISVEDMMALAQDPRVDTTTSQEAVDAGAELPWFTG